MSHETIVITKPNKNVVVGVPVRNTVEIKSEGGITNPINANTLVGTTLASSVVQSSITTVGTITAGQWVASTISVAKGGTGATTAAEAKVNLGILGPVQVFTVPRLSTVGQGKARFYAPTALTITNIRLSVGVAPTGTDLIVDVNKNGTSIFPGGKPYISEGSYTSMNNVPVVTSMNAGDYLTVDIDQVGSTSPGEFLTVQVEFAS